VTALAPRTSTLRNALFRGGRRYGSPALVAAYVILGLFVLVAIFGPLLAPYPPNQTDLPAALEGPSAEHLLGTDRYGRDVLSRILVGARVSLYVGLSVGALSLLIGGVIGALGGYFGGWVDRVVVFIINLLLAFPGFILALAIVAIRGPSLENVIIAIAISDAPRVASVMRVVVIGVRNREFVQASETMGAGWMRMLFQHVIPNALPPVVVIATVGAAFAILSEAGLSFLGLGVAPPQATWGNIIADGRDYLRSDPLLTIAPGVCIALVVIALNLLGDGLRDTLDPRMRRATQRGRA
jgi:peptide/nickel transport system permease protein